MRRKKCEETFQEININWKTTSSHHWISINFINKPYKPITCTFHYQCWFFVYAIKECGSKSAKKSVLIYNLNSQNIWKKSSLEGPVLYQTAGAMAIVIHINYFMGVLTLIFFCFCFFKVAYWLAHHQIFLWHCALPNRSTSLDC